MNVKSTKTKNQVTTVNIFEQQELIAKAEAVKSNLQASTWHELETKGKFAKNDKLSFISDNMLILGCDIGSETHYIRAIDTRGRELSKSAFKFGNSFDGFQSAKEWAVQLAVTHNKEQIVLGLGERVLTGILAEIGDVSRFDDVKEIQKLSGLGLVACSSGKHKGETKISHRGRKRLRYWLFQAAKSAVVHSEEFKELHIYYTTRPANPLKKMQSLIVIACKLLRVIYTILTKGTVYDPKKMLLDIKRPMKEETLAA